MAEIQGDASVWACRRSIVIIAEASLRGWDDNGISRGPAITDFETYCQRFSEDRSEADLGLGLRAALIASRINMTREWEEEQRKGLSFGKRLAVAFATHSVRDVYTGMRNCWASREREIVTFQPLRRKRGGTFVAMADDVGLHETTLIFTASDAELGAALRECLSRCK